MIAAAKTDAQRATYRKMQARAQERQLRVQIEELYAIPFS